MASEKQDKNQAQKSQKTMHLELSCGRNDYKEQMTILLSLSFGKKSVCLAGDMISFFCCRVTIDICQTGLSVYVPVAFFFSCHYLDYISIQPTWPGYS